MDVGGDQGAAHVGIERGGQLEAIDQTVVGQVGQVVAGLFGARVRCAHNFQQAQGGVQVAQRGPVNAQFFELEQHLVKRHTAIQALR